MIPLVFSYCASSNSSSELFPPFYSLRSHLRNEMAIDIITIAITFPKSNTFYYNIKFLLEIYKFS